MLADFQRIETGDFQARFAFADVFIVQKANFQFSPAADVWWSPIETVSKPGYKSTRILRVPETLKVWGESNVESAMNGDEVKYDPPQGAAKGGDMSPPIYGGAVVEKDGGGGRLIVFGCIQFALNQIIPYPLTYPILERYADIRRTLRPLHKDIGDIDTLIAATALEEDLILLTIDHDYERVPGLTYELVNLKKAA